MIEFSCNTTDIQAAVKHIRVALPKRKKERINARAEINIKPESVTLAVIGASYTIDTHTGIYAKVVIPFLLIIRAVELIKSTVFVMQCEDGLVRVDGIEVSSPAIEIVHPENQSKIALTLNYRLLDILQLRSQYPIDGIERMGVLEKREETEGKMTDDVHSAFILLSP
jgi:hypothetical protein